MCIRDSSLRLNANFIDQSPFRNFALYVINEENCLSVKAVVNSFVLVMMDIAKHEKVSHIPLPFYVPASLNYVYFNLNFCIEKWARTVSFLKLESNQMINAVSAKQALKLFCIFFGGVL